jgi:hypothetical protein
MPRIAKLVAIVVAAAILIYLGGQLAYGGGVWFGEN